MKYSSLTAFLLCLAHSVTSAQPVRIDKPIVCDKTNAVFAVLQEKFQEMPVWGGKSAGDQTSYALMLNSETKTWTLLQFNTDTACILGLGNEYVTQ